MEMGNASSTTSGYKWETKLHVVFFPGIGNFWPYYGIWCACSQKILFKVLKFLGTNLWGDVWFVTYLIQNAITLWPGSFRICIDLFVEKQHDLAKLGKTESLNFVFKSGRSPNFPLPSLCFKKVITKLWLQTK